ncbi:unnamed protein product [Caretta caretta]
MCRSLGESGAGHQREAALRCPGPAGSRPLAERYYRRYRQLDYLENEGEKLEPFGLVRHLIFFSLTTLQFT